MESAYRYFHLVVYDDFTVLNKLNDMLVKGEILEIICSQHCEHGVEHFHLLVKLNRRYTVYTFESIILHDATGMYDLSNAFTYLKSKGKIASLKTADEFLKLRQKVEKVEKA